MIEENKTAFLQEGSLLIKNIISKEMSQFLTHTLLRIHHITQITGHKIIDKLVPQSLLIAEPNPYSDTVLESCWPVVESCVGEELIPTYSCGRVYCNENTLPPHTDRPSCEVSLTIQLGKSHNYSWPIYVGGVKYELQEGDAVLYMGCDKIHWRDKCEGPKGYYSGQLFLHYVKAAGQYKNLGGDNRWLAELPFVRGRNQQMINKSG